MARHIRVGVPARKVNFYNLPKYQRRAKKVASFRINQNVISALPDAIERELLSGVFLQQGKANEVIAQVAVKTGMNTNEVIANFLIQSRSEQNRVNLPYTTVFDFATWIQGQKWREAEKEKQGQQ
jgi:hypothetical protein